MLRNRRFLATFFLAVSLSSIAIGTRAVAQIIPPIVVTGIQLYLAVICQQYANDANGDQTCGGLCFNGVACAGTKGNNAGVITFSCDCGA